MTISHLVRFGKNNQNTTDTLQGAKFNFNKLIKLPDEKFTGHSIGQSHRRRRRHRHRRRHRVDAINRADGAGNKTTPLRAHPLDYSRNN